MDDKTRNRRKPRPEKRRAIIDAALSVFIKRGYGEATIDEVVSIAGGSKATVYKYFGSKESLFATVVDELVLNSTTVELDTDAPPREALFAYSVSRLRIVASEGHIALRRVIIGESHRFPKIAMTYYRQGPENSRRQLERYFLKEKSRDALNIDEPAVAAMLFQSMLMHPTTLKTLFCEPVQPSITEITQHVNLVLDKFLMLYGKRE